MSESPSRSHDGSRPPFRPLEQADYLGLAHAAYLKGLLKPFKGKGAWEAWASQCEAMRDGLIALAQRRVLPQAIAYPFGVLPVRLGTQTTGPGTTFLRWRNVERTAMGVHLWEAVMRAPNTRPSLLADLHALEQERLAVNLQISALHALARIARDCANKAGAAEATFAQVLDR